MPYDDYLGVLPDWDCYHWLERVDTLVAEFKTNLAKPKLLFDPFHNPTILGLLDSFPSFSYPKIINIFIWCTPEEKLPAFLRGQVVRAKDFEQLEEAVSAREYYRPEWEGSYTELPVLETAGLILRPPNETNTDEHQADISGDNANQGDRCQSDNPSAVQES